MNQEFKFRVLRSKKTGRYFKFVLYSPTSGVGRYEDIITDKDIAIGKIPDLFYNNSVSFPENLYNHTSDSIEFVSFSITVETENENNCPHCGTPMKTINNNLFCFVCRYSEGL